MKKSLKKLLALLFCFVLCFGTVAEAATLRIPNSVKTIGVEAFYGDTSLDVVYIPSETKTIGDRAFAYSSARIVVFYGNVTSFGSDIFKGCNLEAIECGSWNTNTRNWLVANGYEDILTEWYVKATPYASEAKIKVEWTTGPNATSYTLFYSTGSKGNPLATVNSVNVGNVREYVLTGLESYTTYHIWVVAYRDSHEIDESDDIEVVTKGNGPNPQFDDPVIPGDGPIIRNVYSTDGGKTLTIEFDEYEGAAWYDVIFRNTEADEYETASVNAAESTQDGLVTADAWIETFLQDNTTYRITVKAYDGDLQLLSFESNNPVYYMTDFTGSSTDLELEWVYPSGISLNRDEKEMRVGEYYDLTATITPSDVSDELSAITWGSFDESVAIVEDGEVYANGVGATAVYARTENSLYAYCEITVLPDPIITGNFENNYKSLIVKYGYEDQLSYHVEVEYAKLKDVKLVQVKGNERTTVFTNSHSGKTKADGYFKISAAPGGKFRSLGSRYTFDLVATLKDGTEQVLDTAAVEIGYGIPEPVGDVDAYYDGDDICVSWTNNGDAKWFKVMYYEPNDPFGIYGSVDVNNENAESAIIPSSDIGEYKTYMIYVVAYPTGDVSQYTSRSAPVRVTTVDSSTPAVTARFVGNQKVYAPGETIQIEITYENVCKVHYHNGDNGYNPNSLFNGDTNGDIGEFTRNCSGVQIVELEAQPTSGWYIVEINAKNTRNVQASHFYNYTTSSNVACLGLEYYVDEDGLDAPSWRTSRSMTAIGDLFWSAVDNAAAYRIWISTTNDFSDARAIEVGNVRQYSLTGLITGRTYYVWVQAVNGTGGGPISVVKSLLLSPTSPTVSATITNKNNIPVGGTVPINITYNNVSKVFLLNGTGTSGQIGGDEVQENFSGTETVELPAQYIPGKYEVTIWARDTEGKRATSDEGLKVEYTVTGEPPTPSVSLSLSPSFTGEIIKGADADQAIRLTHTYSNATKLVYTLHNRNNDDKPKFNFSTVEYYSSNPNMPSFTFDNLTFSDQYYTGEMSFIPSSGLSPGTYTLRVTATNDYSSEQSTAAINITIVEDMSPRNRQAIVDEAEKWLTTIFSAAGMPKYTHGSTANYVPSTETKSFHGMPYGAGSYCRTYNLSQYSSLTASQRKTANNGYQYGEDDDGNPIIRSSARYCTECVGFVKMCWYYALRNGENEFWKEWKIEDDITLKNIYSRYERNGDYSFVLPGDALVKGNHVRLVVLNDTTTEKITVIEQTAGYSDCKCSSCTEGTTMSLGTIKYTYPYSTLKSAGYYQITRLKECMPITEDLSKWKAFRVSK